MLVAIADCKGNKSMICHVLQLRNLSLGSHQLGSSLDVKLQVS